MTDEKRYVLHTWTRQSDWNGATVVGGLGAWFWDADGRRYLDLSSQAECCNLGHQHPAVVRAIQEQAAALCYVSNSWGAGPRMDLARRLVAIANGEYTTGGIRAREKAAGAGDQAGASPDGEAGFGRVFFTCDGAEATENAIKMARWYTGRQKILSRYRSYHGATHAAMKAGGDARGWSTSDGLTGVVHLLPPYCFRCPFGLRYPSCGIRCAGHVEEIILFEGPHTVAAIIAEPAAGTNGIMPPPEYWPRLREMQARHRIIADVRGLGLFAVLEMDDSDKGSPMPPFPRPLPWLKQMVRSALDRGVSIAVRGNLVIVSPPLVIDQAELDSGLSVIESLL